MDLCLSNGSNAFQYNDILNSSLTIYAGELQLSIKYQFLVQMVNRRNTSVVMNGYVLVQIEDSHRPMIAIG